MYLLYCIWVPAILDPRQGPLSILVQTRRYFRQGPLITLVQTRRYFRQRPLSTLVQARWEISQRLQSHPLYPRSKMHQGIHETVTWYYWPLLLSGQRYSTNSKSQVERGWIPQGSIRAAIEPSLGKCYRACIKVSKRGGLYFIFKLI